ncbi:MAG: hypothetical protein E3J43_00785 [Candidatus Heimdallarchaeota archaeon]|nr:MAG: hypothetical protein E3J43_00785 [Candidatus Heimdallarchaeota archaeon]
MTAISPPDEIDNLYNVALWMRSTVQAYQEGIINRKLTSGMAKKVLRKIKSYIPTQQEKEHKEAIEDLCISLSTIDRAEGSFEKFYLDSLIEDLERIAKLLEEE